MTLLRVGQSMEGLECECRRRFARASARIGSWCFNLQLSCICSCAAEHKQATHSGGDEIRKAMRVKTQAAPYYIRRHFRLLFQAFKFDAQPLHGCNTYAHDRRRSLRPQFWQDFGRTPDKSEAGVSSRAQCVRVCVPRGGKSTTPRHRVLLCTHS